MNNNIDAATACKRYQESMTAYQLVEFEHRFMEKFGCTPPDKVPAEEAREIFEDVLKGG